MSAPGGVDDAIVRDLDALVRIYGTPGEQARIKEVDHVHPHYRKFIEHAPFMVLASGAGSHVDVSPRGDVPGFVRVQDEKTLLIPDRPGNNRIESLRNIVIDPRVALLFLIPGVNETLRVKGRAQISIDGGLLGRFEVNGRLPRAVLVIQVESVYFQCARALMRSRLWEDGARVDRSALPSIGTILADFSGARLGGAAFDEAQPARLQSNLY
jgi:PPOX class probable FMN-dependent enzyme